MSLDSREMDGGTAALRGTGTNRRSGLMLTLNTSPTRQKRAPAPPPKGDSGGLTQHAYVCAEDSDATAALPPSMDPSDTAAAPGEAVEPAGSSGGGNGGASKALRIVEELLQTEQEYVTDLNDIITGYLRPLADRLRAVRQACPCALRWCLWKELLTKECICCLAFVGLLCVKLLCMNTSVYMSLNILAATS